MQEGEIVQIGTPVELFERPQHTFVGHFIGSPGMNVIPAAVDGMTASVHGATIKLNQSFDTLNGKVELGVQEAQVLGELGYAPSDAGVM